MRSDGASIETKVEAAKVAEERWRDDVAAAAKEGKPPPLKPAAADHVEPFVPTQMVVEDTTIESVVDVVRGNPRGVILWRDELTGWLQNLARYCGGNDRAVLVGAVVGRPVRPSTGRTGRPSTLRGSECRSSAASSRTASARSVATTMMGWLRASCSRGPNDHPTSRSTSGRAGLDDSAVERLQRISALAGNAEPLVLKLDAGAVRLLNEFCAEHHAEAGDYEGLEAGWFGKGPGNVLRLAGVLSLLAWSETGSTVAADDGHGGSRR